MKRYLAVLVMLSAIPLAAQQPRPPVAPAKPPTPAPPQAPQLHEAPTPPPGLIIDPSAGGQPVNIRLDVSVMDQGQPSASQPKTLMVVLADRAAGQTRGAFEDRSISVDARPAIVDGRIRVSMTIESRMPPFGPGAGKDPTLNWQNSFSLLLESGKPMLAFETSDPVTKRKLTIEVKATVLK